MSIDVRAEIEIGCSRGEVASYAMEAENDPQWIGGISMARRLTDPPTGAGTRVERTASFLGRRIEYVMEVTEFAPERRIEMRSVKSPFPMRVTYEFEERGPNTLASIRVEGEGRAFYRVAEPLLALGVKRGISRDLRNLRRLLEGGRGVPQSKRA